MGPFLALAELPPSFKSLLVHGPHPPTAPVHLALSVPDPHHVLLLSHSRSALLHNDPWLDAHSGSGSLAAVSSRVILFYPPTPKHLITVLAMLRTHNPFVPLAPGLTLERPPALLVLHEPSAYFLHQQEEYTLSSYLLLITHALSTVEFLSSPSLIPSLVVFDTGLDRLKLPVFRPPSETAFSEQGEPEDTPRPEAVLFLAQKYFQLSGTFQLRGQTKSDTPVFVLHRIGEQAEEKIHNIAESVD